MRTTLLILTLLIINTSLSVLANQQAGHESFSLTGRVLDFKDSTKLFIYDIEKNVFIDSTFVYNDSFYFSTTLPRSPINVIIRTKDNRKRINAWLENKSMTFTQTNPRFGSAEISGSTAHTTAMALRDKIMSLPVDSMIPVQLTFVLSMPEIC